jgi:hypothetical protein
MGITMTGVSFGCPAEPSALAWRFRTPMARGANAETNIVSYHDAVKTFFMLFRIIPAAVDVDSSVMAGLVPAIYDFHSSMDGRDKPGHDGSASNITVNL